VSVDGELLEPYRRELTGYCYRMLASPHDAEDAVQDTLLRAWRGLGTFENRVGLRPWLYRIATNVCLDMLKGRGRRALPMDVAPAASGRAWGQSHEGSLGRARSEATWVQPIPDDRIVAPDADPADMALLRESVRLAFIAALQHLGPRQRAVLILRDVLHWRAGAVADLLDTSVDAVNSTVRRARAALADLSIDSVPAQPAAVDSDLLGRYVAAFERFDVDAMVALLHEDATLSMPPFELWLHGTADIRRFLAAMAHEGGRDRVLPVAANASPALAVYRPSGPDGTLAAFNLQVLDVDGGRIRAIHAFLDPGLFPAFGLPADPGLART
jgi:RNA polymerase sigma-70 factor, ECF subfamily